MLAVGMGILAFLNWLLPVPAIVSPRPQISPLHKPLWRFSQSFLSMHRLAPIHPPTHRRRP